MSSIESLEDLQSYEMIGKKVRCLKSITFADGTYHNVGDEIVVEEASASYFHLFTDDIHYTEV